MYSFLCKSLCVFNYSIVFLRQIGFELKLFFGVKLNDFSIFIFQPFHFLTWQVHIIFLFYYSKTSHQFRIYDTSAAIFVIILSLKNQSNFFLWIFRVILLRGNQSKITSFSNQGLKKWRIPSACLQPLGPAVISCMLKDFYVYDTF